jgi:hypothetical protein
MGLSPGIRRRGPVERVASNPDKSTHLVQHLPTALGPTQTQFSKTIAIIVEGK